MKPRKEKRIPDPAYRSYFAPEMSRALAITIAVVVTAATCALYFSDKRVLLEGRYLRPLNFELRRELQKDPVLDPRVRLYAFDEATFDLARERDLTLDDWGKLLQLIARSQPSAVIFDHDFSEARGMEMGPLFAKNLAALPYPVIAGVTVSSSPRKDRAPLDVEPVEYDIRQMLKAAKPGIPDDIDTLAKFDNPSTYLYGPPAALMTGFRHVGHLSYRSDGTVPLAVRANRERAVLFAPLYLAKRRGFGDKRLWIGDKLVPSDARMNAVVNYPRKQVLDERTLSVTELIKAARSGEAPPLPKDAVVIISSRAYPDRRSVDSPIGPIPPAYAIAAVASSTLTGNWIGQVPLAWSFILLAGLAGFALAFYLRALIFWPLFLLFVGAIGGLGVWAFAFKNVETPWAFCLLTFAGVAIPIAMGRWLGGFERRARLKEALTGSLVPAKLTTVLRGGAKFSPEPTGQLVTVMFIDIAGFSLSAELQTPEKTFHALRQTIRRLTNTVHSFGGVVINLTGEGMLCIFGYNFDGTEPAAYHADQALSCAVQIQKDSLTESVEARKRDEPVFPLRVGINSGAAYLGDLASRERVDVTVIGPPVSFAKQLETSCDPYCIMLGATTRDMLVKLDATGLTLKRRYVTTKHSAELMEAYECDPVVDKPELRDQAIAAYRDFVKIARKEMRWMIPQGMVVEVSGPHGTGFLSNFSESGLAVRLDKFLGVGVTLNLNIDSEKGALRQRLQSQGLLPLVCEVRWGRALGGGRYLLGLQIRNLKKEQRELLLSELRAAFIDAMPSAVNG